MKFFTVQVCLVFLILTVYLFLVLCSLSVKAAWCVDDSKVITVGEVGQSC